MQFYSSKTSIAERQHLICSYLGLCVSFAFHTTDKKYETRTLLWFFPQVYQNQYGTFHFMITTTTIIIIIMPTSTTSTNNTDLAIMFFRMMITFFACFLIFVLIFFQDGGRIFRFHSVSTKQRQMRQQEIVGLWLSKICSATFATKIAYLWKLRQYIQLWKMFTHQKC